MNTCLYEGQVIHRRHSPIKHAFRYRIAFLYLDLEEIEIAFSGRWLWSAKSPTLGWFRRRDHLGDPLLSLADSVKQLLVQRGITEMIGSIRLLTHPRYFGFAMNPVSFYFCYAEASNELRAVVAEVNNTPWGEQHCYVMPIDANDATTGEGPRTIKEFHVSPFLPMNMEYHWRISPPGDSLFVHLDDVERDERVLDVTMRLQRRPWTTANLQRMLWRFPLLTQQVFLGIYWQAFRLWWKGVPFYSHPNKHRVPASNDV